MTYYLLHTLLLVGLFIGVAAVVDAIQNYKWPRND